MFRVSAIKVNNRICIIKSHRSTFAIKTGLCPPVKNLLVYNRIRERNVRLQKHPINTFSALKCEETVLLNEKRPSQTSWCNVAALATAQTL